MSRKPNNRQAAEPAPDMAGDLERENTPIKVVLEKSRAAIANLPARSPIVGGAGNTGNTGGNKPPSKKPAYKVTPKDSASPENGTF